MTHYKHHLFFCTNQRDGGRACCQNAGASDFCLHAKTRVAELGLSGPGGIRVSQSGCMGRCALGPTLVVYPDAVWYTYRTTTDIDEIIEQHLQNGHVVDRLVLDKLED